MRAPLRLMMLCLAFLVPNASAQTPADTSDVDREVERLLDEATPEDGNPAELVERLAELAEHPLDVNTATANDLARIPALGPRLARALVSFRTAHGPFPTLAALRAVEGLTEAVLDRARPFLRVGPAPEEATGDSGAGLRASLIQRMTRRLDLGRGYAQDSTRTRYTGPPERVYTRWRVRYGPQLSFNVTLEKDPGEPWLWDPGGGSFGFDYVSMSTAFHGAGRVRELIVGDFEAAFGQGLVLWRSFAPGKGGDPTRSPMRHGSGLHPYSSTDENRFFRGVAATVALAPGLALSGFASRRTLDASILRPDSTLRTGVSLTATAFRTGGLHRTPSEAEQKDALRETTLGGDLTYTAGFVRFGVVGYHSRFGTPIARAPEPYRRFQFSGRALTLLSLHGEVSAGPAEIFGEVARGDRGRPAAVAGVWLGQGRRAEVLIAGRRYPRDFPGLHGFAFGERNGTGINEEGLYLGLTIRPHPHWEVAAYVDQYRFPWVRFGVPRPSAGHDTFVRATYHPRNWLRTTLQARSETREEGHPAPGPGGHLLDAVRPETRRSYRFDADYTFSPALRLRARLEWVGYRAGSQPEEHGLLLFQDVRWRRSTLLRLDARLAFFDTDSFDARVFAYEQDLLYTFSVPFFSGRGQRAYLMLTLNPTRQWTFQVKYGETRFEDVSTVGSGLEETSGSRIRELRMQLRWIF